MVPEYEFSQSKTNLNKSQRSMSNSNFTRNTFSTLRISTWDLNLKLNFRSTQDLRDGWSRAQLQCWTLSIIVHEVWTIFVVNQKCFFPINIIYMDHTVWSIRYGQSPFFKNFDIFGVITVESDRCYKSCYESSQRFGSSGELKTIV